MKKWINKQPWVIITILVLFMLLPSLNHLPVSIMEARSFISAREMITDGNWLLPTLNGEPRYQKPPLPTWISAFFAYLLGENSLFAMRLPVVLMVCLLGGMVYQLSRFFLKKEQSIVNALIAISSFYVVGIVFEAPVDIFAHTLMLIGIYFLFQLFSCSNYSWRNALFGGCFIGLSFMSKGPVSHYGLLLSFLLAFGFTFAFKKIRHKLPELLACLLVAVLIGGWWFVYVRYKDPTTFLEIQETEISNWGSYNVKPFYYYWSFFVQSGLWTLFAFVGLLYPYLKNKVDNKKAYQFSFLWTIFAVILLSFIPEKKSRYLMPVLIPLSMNTGFYITYLFDHFKKLKSKWESVAAYIHFALMGLISFAIPVFLYLELKEQLTSVLLPLLLVSFCLFLFGTFFFIYLKKKEIKKIFYFNILFYVFLFASMQLFVPKLLYNDKYKPITHLKEQIEKKELPMYSYGYSPEIIWQYGGKAPYLSQRNGSITLPRQQKFALISLYPIENIEGLDINQIEIELIQQFNLNTKSKNRERLTTYHYIITKKRFE